MKKRILSLLMAVAMCLSLLPTAALAESREGHTHCLCGTTHKAVGDHKDAQPITFNAWDSDNSLPDTAGNYYLTKDVTLNGKWKPASGTVLCLNGKNITQTNKGDFHIAVSGATFTLCDCAAEGSQGKITGGYAGSEGGGGVHSYNGTFYMYGGCITGNSGASAGGVALYGNSDTFTMYGGSITGNEGLTGPNGGDAGSGVYVGTGTSFTMYGGSITGNTSYNAGAIKVWGTITLGGTAVIADNYNSLDQQANLYLVDGKVLNVSTDYPLKAGAKIYVELQSNTGVFTGELSDAVGARQYFRASSSLYGVYVEGNTLKLDNCAHKNEDGSDATTETGWCPNCQQQAYYYLANAQKYQTLSDATKFNSGSSIKLLADRTSDDYDFGTSKYTLDLNGHTMGNLKINSSSVKLKDSVGTGKIASLTLRDIAVGKVFESGHGFYSDSGAWYDSTSTEKNVENVVIKKLPIQSITISGSESVGYGETMELTASAACEPGYDGTPAYSWSSVPADGGTSTDRGTGTTMRAVLGDVGRYIVSCTVSLGSYSKTVTKTVEVTQKTLEESDFTAPTAKEDLYYSGEPQALVESGVELEGAKVWFSRDKNTWTEDTADITGTEVGEYPVYWYIAGGKNYKDYGSQEEPETLTAKILPCPIAGATVTVEPLPYTGDAQTPDKSKVTVTLNGKPLGADDFTLETVEAKTEVGEYDITVTGTGSYTGSASGKWSIGRADLTASVTMADYVYGGTPSTPGVTGNLGNGAVTYYYSTSSQNSGGTEWKDVAGTTLTAGTYYLYAVIGETANYNGCTTQPVKFVVEKAGAPVTTWPAIKEVYVKDELNGASLTGGEADVTGSFSITGTKTWDESGTKTTEVTFTPAGEAANNYEAVSKNISVSVVKRTVKTVVNGSYSITDKDFGTAQDALGLPTAVTIETVDGKRFENVPITWSGYHANTLEPQTLTGTLDLSPIAKEVQQPEAAITASAAVTLNELTVDAPDYRDKTETYTGQPISHELGALTGVASVKYEYEGTSGTNYAKSETAPTNAGSYTVTAVFTMAYGYRQLAPSSAALTIAKANQSNMTAEDVSATYGDTDKRIQVEDSFGALSYEVTDGTDVVSVDSTGKLTFLKAGDATVTISAAGDGNHNTSQTTANITVSKKSITIKALDRSAYIGGAELDLSKPKLGTDYEITGLVGKDALESGVSIALTCDADMNKTGQYDITITVTGADSRYDFETENGTLTVSYYPVVPSAPATVTVPVSSDHATVEVKAEVSKGNATVEVSDEQIEKVAADGAGTVTVDVSGLKDVESVTVPTRVVEKANDADDTGLTVALPAGSVGLDEKALDSVAENADGKDVTISVESVSTSALPPAVKELIGMEPTVLAVVDVNVTIGGVKQSTFNGGKVTVSIPYTPKKGENTSKLAVWFIRDDGKIEKKNGYYDAKNKCFVFETDHLSQYLLVNTNAKLTFTDVPADAFYADAVDWAVENNITNGNGVDLFYPSENCTRAQIVTFLWRAAGCPEAKGASTFTDVPANAYYAEAVAWAVENGITDGIGGKFAPDLICTREQAVTFLYRAAGAPAVTTTASQFSDVPAGAYYTDAVAWAVENNITDGIGGGKFAPKKECTRSEIVTFLFRAQKK